MQTLIADTFADSLARLTGDEQKAVKTTAFDLQLNPANPGMKFHRLDKAKDKNFWSVRVNSDIRIIVHKTAGSLLLCYVDHHDKAYDWAGRRKLETHPKTGAAQMVEVRETVQEIVVPKYVETTKAKPTAVKKSLFAKITDDVLLGYGVPPDWLADVKAANEDTLFALAEHLPAEAAEALLELATGGKPRVAPATDANPFEHPDARRRFRVMGSVEELERALEYPWDKWTVFLHPEQRQWIEKDYAGPARVSGSAGTGKTIVALHRAVYLARQHPDARVLLTTFSDALANALQTRLRRLLGNEPRIAERLEVASVPAIGRRLHEALIGPVKIADRETIRKSLAEAALAVTGHTFSLRFLLNEWDQIVDAWQLSDWESYRDVARLGRKTRLSEAQRAILWKIFQLAQVELSRLKRSTEAAMFTHLAEAITKGKALPFAYVVLDEAQDVSIPQMRFFAAMAGDRPNGLFFAGDIGQQIFQQPFSWKNLGVDIRGRSRTLRVNYRTSHQIRSQADKLLEATVTDADLQQEDRTDTVSVFNGPPPAVRKFVKATEEITAVGEWLASLAKSGVVPDEFGVFVRSPAQLDRAKQAAKASGVPFRVLDESVKIEAGFLSVSTMHLAKGLEFRAVAVMACDDDVIPLQERMSAVGDDADLKEVYDTERQLLYVACTRARDHLLVSGAIPVSEYLDDLTATKP
ncbi:UvrD-helicase domain-containing protein [Zavarzinella formosa]|uniref:UvrD-helicase domain-containing protein n=1 Tax=Zavarzinella formosa TaxID=360055 RepID=UPI00031D6D69|nr:UvrD-helicase domain-containing protein [Zavarzinella formosa]